jgi:UDP-N-acetylglucosamine diphosphorylase/glucosamine-1-phosphate N-acetyltransferase
MSELSVVIMAAGKGTRMKSDLAKVLHRLKGKAMIHYVIEAARRVGAGAIVVVVGHQKDLVIDELKGQGVFFAIQEPQLGTGHALMCALPQIVAKSGQVLILSGDTPLIKPETLANMLNRHMKLAAAATVLTATTENPRGYGRIIRHQDGFIQAIIEERDADEATKALQEINGGIYLFNLEALRQVLPLLTTNNNQKEYYLTDAVRLLVTQGKRVAAYEGSFREALGVNTVEELEEAAGLIAERELRPEDAV